MNKRKPNDVFAEVDKILLFYKVVGLCPLVHSLGELRTSKRWVFSSVFTLGPFLVTNVHLARYLSGAEGKTLHNYMTIARIILIVLSLFLTWLMCNTKVRSLNRFLRKIQMVDYFLFSVGEQIPPSKSSKVILLSIGTLAIPFGIWTFIAKNYLVGILLFSLFYPYILIFVAYLFFDRLCSILFTRYQAITNVLRRCILLEECHKTFLSEKMNFCFESLYSSGESINDFFSLQILFIVTTVFIISFDEVYIVMNIISSGQISYSNILFIVTHLCVAVVCFLTMWRFGYRFSSISNKAEDFNLLLLRLMMEDENKHILYNEKLNLHIMMKRKVVFSACGLFQLDFKLVHSMLASATTYLVLLIQFGPLSADKASTQTTTPDYSTTALPIWSNTSY